MVAKYTILTSGHCTIMDHPSYICNTLAISSFVTAINKILQMIMFSAQLSCLFAQVQ